MMCLLLNIDVSPRKSVSSIFESLIFQLSEYVSYIIELSTTIESLKNLISIPIFISDVELQFPIKSDFIFSFLQEKKKGKIIIAKILFFIIIANVLVHDFVATLLD